jgi:hypothetical protein
MHKKLITLLVLSCLTASSYATVSYPQTETVQFVPRIAVTPLPGPAQFQNTQPQAFSASVIPQNTVRIHDPFFHDLLAKAYNDRFIMQDIYFQLGVTSPGLYHWEKLELRKNWINNLALYSSLPVRPRR